MLTAIASTYLLSKECTEVTITELEKQEMLKHKNSVVFTCESGSNLSQ